MAEPFDIVGEDYVLAILDSFGGLRPMAKHLGLGVSTVQGWKQRHKIPANRLADIAKAAKDNHIILPDSFTQALNGDSRMAPQKLNPKTEPKKEATIIEEESFLANLDPNQVFDDHSSDVFNTIGGSSKNKKPANEQSDADLHGAKSDTDLPKSTAAHWALLISVVALIAVITRPLWSGPIDQKFGSSIAHHGTSMETSQGEHGNSMGVDAVLEKFLLLEERLTVVEQANASLALLSFNLQKQSGDSGVFGDTDSVGMSAEELQRLDDIGLNVELLKKDSVSSQTQIGSLSGLLNQLEENSRIISRRLEDIESESGRLFERNFDRSIGTFYSLERLDARIHDGLAFTVQLNDFDEILQNSDFRSQLTRQIEILNKHSDHGIVTLPVLVREYTDSLYPILVAKTDKESIDWQEQVKVRLRSLIHFKHQRNIEEQSDLLQAEYFLGQGKLEKAITLAETDILRYGEGTAMNDWLERAIARRDTLQAIDSIRLTIGKNIIDSIRDLQKSNE